MKEISLEEIKRVEKLLLPEGKTFGDESSERVKVIKEINESCDVVACPGSGKTTVLLAKLIILANRMPFDDYRGICVLTHTNVAIDLIKSKANLASDKLFKYPNFFGTIQSFVDRYLAIPAYTKKYPNRSTWIDNDTYKSYFDRNQYRFLGKKAIHFCKVKSRKNYPYSISYLDLVLNEDNFCESLKLNLEEEVDKKIYEALKRTKEYMFEAGYLTFKDAYDLASLYIKKHTDLGKAFCHRFKYLFIDEMQDTDNDQLNIIEKLFDNSDTIVQYFGDPNQAIYDSNVQEDMLWNPGKNGRKILKISDSKRFGKKIADILDKIKINDEIDMGSSSQNSTVQPKLLLYKSGQEHKVLEKFIEIINENKEVWLPELKKEKPIYKAIGWIAKERTEKEITDGKLNISSYYKDFQKKADKNKQKYNNLRFYLCRHIELSYLKGAKVYSNLIVLAFLEVLNLGEIRIPETKRLYTKNTLLKYLKENNQLSIFLEKVANWAKRINQSTDEYDNDIIQDIRTYINTDFQKFFGYNIEKIKDFVESRKNDTEENKDKKEKGCIYYSSKPELNGIEVEVGTVHSIKGETHTATLYMETFYNKYFESKRLAKQLTNNEKDKKTIKMLHVGFSRPTHLLCFAALYDNVKNDIEIFENAGWKVNQI
jgi:superfamily I DNA/RNA helicase